MDSLACFSDASDSEEEEEEEELNKKQVQKEKLKRKFDYKQLIDRGYVAPDLTSFVDSYREIEKKEQEEIQAKKRIEEEKEQEYASDIAKARAFAQKWDTWLEPAADEARAELEAKKLARSAAFNKKKGEENKPWFASVSTSGTEDSDVSVAQLTSSSGSNQSTQLAVIDTTMIPTVPTEEEASSFTLVPVSSGQDVKDKSFPLVATAETAERRVMTFDSSGNRALVAVAPSSASTVSQQKLKTHLTHAQKIAKKYTEEKRKEARGVFNRKKGGGIENLPVKQQVTTYNQRLNNIMHMEKNLDTLLKKAKPTYKDQRSDMAYDDLRKCGAGAGN